MGSPRNKEELKRILLIFFLAVILRSFFIFVIHPPEKYIYNDMEIYTTGAVKVALGIPETAQDTFYPPGPAYLYSLFFHAPSPFLAIKIFHVFMGIMTCLFIYGSADILFGKKAAYLAGLFSSLNYLFVDFTGYVLSEGPFIFGLSAMFYFMVKSVTAARGIEKRLFSFLTGLLLIFSASFKTVILLLVPVFGVWLLFSLRKYRLAVNLPYYFLGFLPLFAALCVRTYALTGDIGGISTNTGINFYQGRSRVRITYFHDPETKKMYFFAGSPVAIHDKYPFDLHLYGPTPSGSSGLFFREGLRLARKDPGKTFRYSIANIYDLFRSAGIWPSSSVAGIFPKLVKYFNTAVVFLIIIPAMFVFCLQFRDIVSSPKFLVCLPVLVLLLASFIFHGESRYRIPFDVFFIILAAKFYSSPPFEFFKNQRARFDDSVSPGRT